MYVSKVDLLEAFIIEVMLSLIWVQYFFAMLFSTVCIWSLHVRFSSIQTPKNIIEDSLLTVNPFIFRFGSRKEILSFLDDFWKKESFLTFSDNLLALNQLLTFVSSLFIFSNEDVNVTLSKPDISKKYMNLSCLLLWAVHWSGRFSYWWDFLCPLRSD